MKRDRKWFMMLLVGMLTAACSLDAYQNSDDDDWQEEEENKPLSETWSAVPEDFYCLNVAYYVPADLDTLMLWHKRLSGITIHTQEFFEENMTRHGYDKTFGLVRNDSNRTYVDMDYIKSELAVSELKIEAMAEEVLAYYAAHPERKMSNHFLVYLPEYDGSFVETIYVDGDGNGRKEHAITFAGVDTEKFDPKFLESGRGRVAYLSKLGELMYEEMHNFFQADNNGSLMSPQFSLSGYIDNAWNYSLYANDMTKINLTEVDAVCLNTVQVFNKRDDYALMSLDEVEISSVRFSWAESEYEYPVYERDTLSVLVNFEDPGNLAGVIMYLDPWNKGDKVSGKDSLVNIDPNSPTTMDAVGYWMPAEDFIAPGLVMFTVNWSDMNPDNIKYTDMGTGNNSFATNPHDEIDVVKAYFGGEVRFRFVSQDGGIYPDPLISHKGEWGTMYRIYYRINRWWNGVYFGVDMFSRLVPDVVERYPNGVRPSDLNK